MHGPERERGAAHPVRQGGAVKRDALARIDLRLAIERGVVGIFGDQHMRHQRLGRNAVLDQPLRCRRLGHFACAGAAGVFGTARNDHLQLHRDDIEPFGDILANPVLEPAAARAGLVLDVDDDLFARQMRRQCAAIDLPSACGGLLLRRRTVVLRRSLRCRERLLHIFQPQRQLVRIEPLGAATEAVALQFLDDRHQPLNLMIALSRLLARRRELLGMPRPLGQKQSAQRLRIGGERIRSGRHICSGPHQRTRVAP
jgi:hypothetical protein